MKTQQTNSEPLPVCAGSVSDTPRTDANESITTKEGCPCIAPDFARQLEREGNSLRNELLKARMLLAQINLFMAHDDPLYADVVAYFAGDSQNSDYPERLSR